MGKKGHHPVGKQRILETAERLFLEHGYQAVSIRDIANACGVTNAALYYYFPSKEALFREVLRQHILRLTEALQHAREHAANSPREQLIAMLEVYTRWVLAKRASFFTLRRDLLALMQQGVKEGVQYPLRGLKLAIIEPFDDLLQQATAQGLLQPPPGNTSLSSILLGMLHGLLSQSHENGNPAPEEAPTWAAEVARWVVETFWRGLSA